MSGGRAAPGDRRPRRVRGRGTPTSAATAADGVTSQQAAVAAFCAHGATSLEAAELLAYQDQGTEARDARWPDAPVLPLAEESCVEAWAEVADAPPGATAQTLRRQFVQLRFPIRAGVRHTLPYQVATRHGVMPAGTGDPLLFERPDDLHVRLHATAVGRIALITAPARTDFEALVRALVHANEPAPLPPSLGACVVSGYLNWHRVAARRRRWADAHPEDRDGRGWTAEYRRSPAERACCQDRFVLLAEGPYSGVPAAALGLDPDEWRAVSRHIRVEHECAHYVALRVSGRMRNALADELAADYVGITAARGRFEPEWLLQFMQGSGARAGRGGRLANYRGTPPLGDGAFRTLRRLLLSAVDTLARFDPYGAFPTADAEAQAWIVSPLGLAGLGLSVLGVGLAGLASAEGAAVLDQRWTAFVRCHRTPATA